MKATAADRIVCRNCKTRYDTSQLTPGSAFSCRQCGQILHVPGSRSLDKENRAEVPFGQMAVDMGFITTTQLAAALKEQKSLSNSKLRLGDLLLDKKLLTSRQVSEILQAQGAKVALLIPGYEIVEKLGEGGMGAVFKGEHLASHKTVAMKILAERLARRREFLERFHREARVAIDLDHPHIVKGFDEGSAGETHYFVMEYVYGKTTSQVLRKRGKFGERRAMDIARQVATALDYAHARGIVHRDIKPDNLMINRNAEVKLADYGLVKYVDDVDVAGLTTEGQIMGTPNYISPEQASGTADIDIRSDIYSLGATLFHLTTGRTPYGGNSVAVIMGKHVSAPTPDPREKNKDLSANASAIIMKMMAKNIEKRYQTPRQLLDDLDTYFSAKHTTGVSTSDVYKPEPTPWGATSEEDLGGPAIVEDEDEEQAETSRTAKTLLAAGIFVLFVGFMVAFFHLWAGNDTSTISGPNESDVSSKQTVVVPRRLPTDTTDTMNEADKASASAYKEASRLAGDSRIRALRQIVKNFPGSTPASLAQKEIADYQRNQRDQANQKQLADRRQQEKEGQDSYSAALQLGAVKPTIQYEKALKDVISRYRDTSWANKAQKKLRDMYAWRADIRKREEEKKRRNNDNPLEQQEFKKKEAIARITFIDLYRRSLKVGDWDGAEKYAKLMAKDKRYPVLNRLGQDCEADALELQRLVPAISAALAAAGTEDQEISFVYPGDPEMPKVVKARVLSVRGDKINMVKGQFPFTRSIDDLHKDELIRLIKAGHNGKPPTEVLIGLYYFSNGTKAGLAKAKTIFSSIRNKDPRSAHHMSMLEWK